jgi:hypothetical protein
MAKFKMNTQPLTGDDTAHLTFSADGPARFEVMVGKDGSVHLFGYSGEETDEDQDPNLVFDTDGSFAVFTDEEA